MQLQRCDTTARQWARLGNAWGFDDARFNEFRVMEKAPAKGQLNPEQKWEYLVKIRTMQSRANNHTSDLNLNPKPNLNP